MNIDLKNVSSEAHKVIETVNAALIAAGLPSYTDVVQSRQTIADSARDSALVSRDNDKLAAKLLDSALRHLQKNNPDGARDVLQSLRPTFADDTLEPSC